VKAVGRSTTRKRTGRGELWTVNSLKGEKKAGLKGERERKASATGAALVKSASRKWHYNIDKPGEQKKRKEASESERVKSQR